MNYDKLIDFWTSFGVDMGFPSGRIGESSGSVVDDSGEGTTGGDFQGEVPTVSTALEQELSDVVSGIATRLEEEAWVDSGYYLSDVYACESTGRASQLAAELVKRGKDFRGKLFIVSLHDNHVHTVHSCKYSNRSCRCSFNKFPEAQRDLRRLLRTPRALETFKRRDWENITKYFCTKGRRVKEFKLQGAVQGNAFKATAISDAILSSQDGGGPSSGVEDCTDPINCNVRRTRAIDERHSEDCQPRKRRHAITPGGSAGLGGVARVILDIINKYAICPISEIVHTREYLENAIAIKRLDDRDVKNALDTRSSIISHWTKEDFDNFYNDANTVKIWSARSLDTFDLYYLPEDESYRVCDELLTFQLQEDKYKFCKQLVDVTEMKIPKRNCFVVISVPSAGKNFFFDAVKDYYLNAGQMCNPNKYNNFAYQDCHNRRILLWNEPNFEPREIENLKMLLGGDNFSANVKCKPQANVKRTPIVVLSNNVPRFVNNPAFEDRIYTYYWQAAPFLKDVTRKPRPDTVMKLIYDLKNAFIE